MGVGARGIGQLKAAQLKQLAQTSVASPELAQQVSFEMRPLIAQHDLLDQQTPVRTRESPRSSTARWPDGCSPSPGSGRPRRPRTWLRSADIWRFSDVDQLLAYAGVHPKEQSSGKKGANPETNWTMAKTGNAYLRAAAYRMAVVGVQHNPIIVPTTLANVPPASQR